MWRSKPELVVSNEAINLGGRKWHTVRIPESEPVPRRRRRYAMNTRNPTLLQIIEQLIRVCLDGEAGYRAATERTADIELARLFSEHAIQRGEFVRELKSRARSLGGDPERATMLSDGHPGWSAAADSEAPSVLSQCERAEDAALQQFREALKENLDPVTRGIASRQYVGIQSAHDRIKQLRDSAAYQKA